MTRSEWVSRAAIELTVRDYLDKGIPCSLMNMEHQLITGYDDTGFITAQPWAPHNTYPPDHLTFKTWGELGEESQVIFFALHKRQPVPEGTAIAQGLRYAIDLYRRPEAHTQAPYFVGAEAYGKWIAAIQAGHGTTHGNWWNATVWGECRGRAADFFAQIAATYPVAAALSGDLAIEYGAIAEALRTVSDRDLDSDEKVRLLKTAGDREAGCIGRIEELAAAVKRAAAT
jgi:hypothetical protein